MLSDQVAGPEALRFSHSGEQFVLGYGTDFFGIWDRTQPGGPVVRFPRTNGGWEEAWREFVSRERRFVPVTPSASPTGAAPAQEFRSAWGPAKMTIALIGVSSLLAVLTMAARAGLIAKLNEFRRGATQAAGVVDAGNAVDALAVATTALILVAGIAWIVWQYRAQANLRALGVPGLRYSPTAAAAWWVVPFANFVMPFLTVRELWTASGTAEPDLGGQPRRAPPLLLAWWTFWLARVPLGAWAAAVAHGPSATPRQLTARAYAGLGIDASILIAAVLAVTIVRGVQRRQEALAQTARRAVPAEPL
jgi:heme/copper-type cytochrome/quinol oxidase subunit 2